MPALISSLTRYPVKGLSGQALENVLLEAGQGFPGDRRFGFARPDSGFDPKNPKPLPKTKFYMLARDSSLALLNTAFDDNTGRLTMSTPAQTDQFDITSNDGKSKASQFLKSYLSLSDDETPQLYEATPHRFTDVSVDSAEMMNAVSLVNAESVNEFSKAIGADVDPARFRGNILLEGVPPFSELEWIGREIVIGEVQLRIVQRTKRCSATEVDLETGERNIKTPKLLLKNYNHMDMGVYAEVVRGGVITTGDRVELA